VQRTADGRAHGPIFVVGCPRSGTTLVRNLLDSHPNIACGEETQFLTELVAIEQHHWDRLVDYGIERAAWREHVRDLFSWLHDEYARRQGKIRWADKSPSYALILDYIEALYPDCQVLHVIRDGRDVLASYQERWGWRGATTAITDWPTHVRAARRWGEQHPEDRYMEIKYEELVTDTKGVMGSVIEWLGEPWDDALLRFGDVPHFMSARTVAAPPNEERQRQQGDYSKVYSSSVGTGSSARRLVLHRAVFERRNAKVLNALGYGKS